MRKTAPTADAAPSEQQSREDHDDFWDNPETLVVAPHKIGKNEAPDWKTWPLLLGKRVRQVWTVSLLNTLARDNKDHLVMFERERGKDDADAIRRAFEERRAALGKPAQ